MTLAGKRILVVEDEYMIAADLKRALLTSGAIVAGPVGDVAAALALAGADNLDAAILDLNLEGDWTYPVADRLDADGVPYVFLTGYDRWVLPERYSAKTTIAKPYLLPSVVEKVGRLVAEAVAR